jgi:hypothetical protein
MIQTAIIRSRCESEISGDPRYFTGKACRYGHISERYTASGNCIDCMTGEPRSLVRGVPFRPAHLKRPRELTTSDIYDLEIHLQTCINQWCEDNGFKVDR